MSLKALLLGDLGAELDATRRRLEAGPDAHIGWRPHEKSWPIGGVANHIANLPMWAATVLRTAELDLDALPPPDGMPGAMAPVLDRFDRHRADLERAVADASDADLSETWTMRKGDHVLMSAPRAVVLRQAGLTHMAHHRGQLTVYLRLLDVPVPETYGPTADSPPGF